MANINYEYVYKITAVLCINVVYTNIYIEFLKFSTVYSQNILTCFSPFLDHLVVRSLANDHNILDMVLII